MWHFKNAGQMTFGDSVIVFVNGVLLCVPDT